MDNSEQSIKQMLESPLAEIQIDFRLRRRLINEGYTTLAEALGADEEELEDEIGVDAFDSFLVLRERLFRDPAGFASQTREKRERQNSAQVRKKPVVSRGPSTVTDDFSKQVSAKTSEPYLERSNPLPNIPAVSRLRKLEESANEAMTILADHADNAIIAECFPRLVYEIDDIRIGFRDLFKHYSGAIKALNLSCLYFPNAFLVFVAQSASKDFDGEAFWKNLFEYLGVNSQQVQTELKKAFYQGVRNRGLPFFRPDENDFHYLNTALLHGGFSESFWHSMWMDVVLPFAKRFQSGRLSQRSGAELLASIKSDNGVFRLRRTFAKRIIEKAPQAMLEPLLDMALSVARDTIEMERSSGASTGNFEMLSSHGMPDAAMQALREILETRGGRATRRLVYLPTAELRIEPEVGRVHLHWDAQEFPCHFAGKAVAYMVNGVLEDEVEFTMGVGKSFLPERDVALNPSERFDVELQLLDSDETKSKLSSLGQTFDRTRPGTFEFLQGSDGIFRLRNTRERIKKPVMAAFLTKAGLRVFPGPGMRELEIYEADDRWVGGSVQVFEISPGSSGSVVNLATQEEVACWQEDYKVDVDRSHVIGKTSDRRDLYGYDQTNLGMNAALPEITVSSLDVLSLQSDLDIYCYCDGNYVSLSREVHQDIVDYEYVPSGRLVIKPYESMLIPDFVNKGSIRIVQKSTGRPIFSYKFAVAPLRAFGISAVNICGGNLIGTYVFEAMDKVTVPDEFGDYEMVKRDKYEFTVPLEDASMRLDIKLRSTGDKMTMLLTLAAVSVLVPEEIIEINRKRALCALDIGEVDGRMTIVSSGRRHSRNAAVFIGQTPILYKKLSGNTTYSFDIFKDPAALALFGAEEEKDVVLTLTHGETRLEGETVPAMAQLPLAQCVTGLGLGEICMRWRRRGPCICFEHAALSDLEIRLFETRRRQCIGILTVEEGATFAALPRDAEYLINTNKSVSVTIVPVSLFGDADEEKAVTLELHR